MLLVVDLQGKRSNLITSRVVEGRGPSIANIVDRQNWKGFNRSRGAWRIWIGYIPGTVPYGNSYSTRPFDHFPARRFCRICQIRAYPTVSKTPACYSYEVLTVAVLPVLWAREGLFTPLPFIVIPIQLVTPIKKPSC